MKKILKNKKGFTLIELLAVIVILAILVMVAIPAVTKYLNTARAGTYVDNAKSAISAVRNDVVINGGDNGSYKLERINGLLEKKLINSPFGGKYCDDSEIKVTIQDDGTTSYEIKLYDMAGHGWNEFIEENELTDKNVAINPNNAIKDCKNGTPTTEYACYKTENNKETLDASKTTQSDCEGAGGKWKEKSST